MDRNSRVSGVARVFILAGAAGMLLMSLGSTTLAQSNASASHAMTVEGTWFVQVTQRNCATNAALGSFNSLVTFAPGGILTESPGSLAFAPGQRTPGHGTWKREGEHTFSQRVVALILFDTAPNLPVSPGFLRGWQTISHTVALIDADSFTSAGGAEFYDSNGVLYRSGCSTAVAERVK